MPKKKAKKRKVRKTRHDVGVYEKWLARQPVRRVKGKRGFISQ